MTKIDQAICFRLYLHDCPELAKLEQSALLEIGNGTKKPEEYTPYDLVKSARVLMDLDVTNKKNTGSENVYLKELARLRVLSGMLFSKELKKFDDWEKNWLKNTYGRDFSTSEQKGSE